MHPAALLSELSDVHGSQDGTATIGRRVTRNSNYKSLNSLMRHIRDSSGIRIGGGSDKRALAQMESSAGTDLRHDRPHRQPSQDRAARTMGALEIDGGVGRRVYCN